ncbi:hypothetical protein [Blastococcus sp. CT_GayMR16]|uniref:hypothetical protein n=1 Tax=Blastococcus sp. CT_GayMR16 TaxID=2559607 RepID=UPI0010743E0A|nr:hypothetical protein [Blastococcus sp. CT_GayMR16]TFV82912.1 hypothetical protein E4P38_21820 [Blastococcus sp. CT_GayMR16]
MQRDPAPPQPSTAASGSTGWLVLLWVAWVLVPAGLAAGALGSLLTFFGEGPTEAERADARRLFVLAAIAGVAIPVAGLIVSLRARRQGSATAFGFAAALAFIGAVLVLIGTSPRQPGSAVPSHAPGGACQEHSGGDTRCPGG